MHLSFLGTGLMGARMAARLLDHGHTLTVFNRTPEKAAGLVERGAQRADSARQALEASDVSILMLGDGAACKDVLAGAELRGRLIVNMSTVGPKDNGALAEHTRAQGGRFLEAPVLGSTPQAEAGGLMIMAGGEEADFEAVREVLGTFGPQPRHVGPIGAGAAMKLACNHLNAAETSAFALSLALVRRSGLDVDQ